MTFNRYRNQWGGWSYSLDGVPIGGVTTMIGGGVPKPALVGWSARLAAEYAADNIDLITRMERDAAVDLIKKAADRSRNEAGNRGKAVHAILERLLVNDQVDVPDELAGSIDAFLRFDEEWRPEVVAVETAVYNRRWRYAGTFDLLCRLRGELVLVDFKTGASGVWPEVCLQLAAYRHAEMMLLDGREQPMPDTVAGYALWLHDGNYELRPVESGDDQFTVFLRACAVAAWSKREDLIGLPIPAPEAVAS